METGKSNQMPDWAPLVLTYARPSVRSVLEPLLRLDTTMARIVGSVSEPALGQLRMAWWRDEILRSREPAAPLPPDPLLQSIIRQWEDGRRALVDLIDGWEHLLSEKDWSEADAAAFQNGRAAGFSMLAELVGHAEAAEAAARHGTAWARADLGAMGQTDGKGLPELPKLPKALRPLAIIGGLSRRSIGRGNAPLVGDRLSPLVAIRLGIFGT